MVSSNAADPPAPLPFWKIWRALDRTSTISDILLLNPLPGMTDERVYWIARLYNDSDRCLDHRVSAEQQRCLYAPIHLQEDARDTQARKKGPITHSLPKRSTYAVRRLRLTDHVYSTFLVLLIMAETRLFARSVPTTLPKRSAGRYPNDVATCGRSLRQRTTPSLSRSSLISSVKLVARPALFP